ncbi:MAG TPA: pitrilysin family protein [Gammaproteobacteria bacterium]|nr:pitrilysin family protein [Gammaproteobacteria bacterium]
MIRKISVLSVALLLTACASHPQSAPQVAAAAATGSTATATAQASQVLRATLKNGLKVVIVKNRLAPVVTTEMNYLVGSNQTPAGFPGTAHALEHTMFRGSPGLSSDQLMNITSAMGGYANADTQQTITQYYFTVPAEDLDVALHIASIRMRGLDATEKDWDKERGAIEQEVARDLSSPTYLFYQQLLAAMYKGTPYAHDALGTRPSFDKTTAKDLKKFYDTWYAPNNAILVIVGDVEPQQALVQVRKLFADIPARQLPERTPIKLGTVQTKTLNLPTDLPYGLTLTSFRMPGYQSPDYAAGVILSDVLASQRGDLYALVPEGKALYAGFQGNSLPDTGLGFAIGVFPKGGDSAALTKEIQTRLQQTVQKGVPADLVEAAKKSEIAAFEFQKNSVSGLANAWSDALALQGRQAPDDLVVALNKVTVADVNRVAKQYLNQEHAITAILTPESSGKPVASKGFGGAENFGTGSSKPVPLPEWAGTALSRLSVPKAATAPVVSTLPNGIKLIVQPEQVSDTVSVYGGIRNQADLQTPKDQEGVSSVLNGLFAYGSANLNRVQLVTALDDIAASADFGTSFSLKTPAAQFDRGLQILADVELHPAFPAQAFKVVQMQTARAQAGELQSPGYLFQRAFQKALLPAGDPVLREATPQSIMSLKRDDVTRYYQQVLRPDMTSIVVIGKITPAAAKAAVEKYFGAWKAEGAKPDVDLPPVPANKAAKAVVPDKSRVQDEVGLSETVAVNIHSPDRFALELGNEVLSGGLFANRLYQDLRVKSGLVYNVSSDFSLTRTRGQFTVQYGSDPDKVSRASALVVENLKAMQKAPVTADELNRAKASLLRQIPLRESSIGSIGNSLLKYSMDGLPLDEPQVAARHYLGLGAEDVQAAYRKWLHPADLVQIVLGPNPQ